MGLHPDDASPGAQLRRTLRLMVPEAEGGELG
jgi:hypothetical protein